MWDQYWDFHFSKKICVLVISRAAMASPDVSYQTTFVIFYDPVLLSTAVNQLNVITISVFASYINFFKSNHLALAAVSFM